MRKVKLLLTFPKNLTAEPVTYNLVKDFDLRINILKAHVNYNIEGRLLIELDGEEQNIIKGILYLQKTGISVVTEGTGTFVDFEKCISCGACVAACETGALSLDKNNKLVFNGAKCLECMLCERACPQRIIRNVFN